MNHKGDFLYTAYVDKTGKIQYTYHNSSTNKTEKKFNYFKPKLGVVVDYETDYKSIYGDYLQIKEFNNIFEYRSFLKQCPEAHGNIQPIYQFLSEYFSEQKVPDKMDAWFVDIEVYTQDNFPKADKALYEINAITLYSIAEEIYYTFSLKEYESKDRRGKYLECIDEQHLLEMFIRLVEQKNISILSGHNAIQFDIPYIVKRLKYYEFKSIGIRDWLEENIGYSGYIQSIQILDYMELYKLFGQALEKYSLEFICQAELQEGKIKDPRPLWKIYDEDFEKFIDYNIHDVRLMVKLDKKLELIKQALDITSVSKVLPGDLLAPVKGWDGYLLSYLNKKNIMIPPEKRGIKDILLGGYTGYSDEKYSNNPTKFIMICDITSSYPHQIMQVNISPETLIPEKDIPFELLEIRKRLGYSVGVERQGIVRFVEKLSEFDLDNPILQELNELLKEYNYTMSASGQFYTKEKIGIFPSVVKEMFVIRKQAKDNVGILEKYESKIKKLNKKVKNA